MSVLVFDIGGTQMRIAVSPDGRRLGRARHFRTPRTWTAARKVFSDFSRTHLATRVTKIIGGIPGVLDAAHAMLRVAPCLPRWVGAPIRRDLAAIFSAPVRLENDCVLGALGEARRGAGKGSGIVAYLAIGTGVGGARIVGGRIDRHATGFEPGHQIVAGNKTLSDLVAGDIIARRQRRPTEAITAKKVWRKLGPALAVGIRNTVMLWSPDIVVLGGTVIYSQPEFYRAARQDALKQLRRYGFRPRITRGKLGDAAGLYGALALSQHSAF